MARHRYDDNIAEFKNHFDTVIDWVDSIFEYTGMEMRGREWGSLYKTYHQNAYSKSTVEERMNDLFEDTQVKDKKGIFEYMLEGEKDRSLLNPCF